MAEPSEIALRTAVINRTQLNWVKEHYEGFWGKVERGEWEPQSYREIDRHVTPDTIFVDFGANIGALTLFAAKNAAQVICFEPDPLFRANLLANIAVNPDIADKVTVIAKAAHPGERPVRLGSQASGGNFDVEHNPARSEDSVDRRDHHATRDQCDAAEAVGDLCEDGYRGR